MNIHYIYLYVYIYTRVYIPGSMAFRNGAGNRAARIIKFFVSFFFPSTHERERERKKEDNADVYMRFIISRARERERDLSFRLTYFNIALCLILLYERICIYATTIGLERNRFVINDLNLKWRCAVIIWEWRSLSVVLYCEKYTLKCEIISQLAVIMLWATIPDIHYIYIYKTKLCVLNLAFFQSANKPYISAWRFNKRSRNSDCVKDTHSQHFYIIEF